MISEHVPCQKLLVTLNLTFYVLLIYHKYLYLNLHGACMEKNQITEKCFYWMPKVRGHQSVYLVRQNTMKASAFLMMMAAAMIMMTYLHNTHTFWDISVKNHHLHAVLTVLHGQQIVLIVLKHNTRYILHGMLQAAPDRSSFVCYELLQWIWHNLFLVNSIQLSTVNNPSFKILQ